MTATLVMFSAWPPVFFTVTACVVVLFTGCEPKS